MKNKGWQHAYQCACKKIQHKCFLKENFYLLLHVFNIINRKTLLEYCKKYPKAATALQEWYYELAICDFKNFN